MIAERILSINHSLIVCNLLLHLHRIHAITLRKERLLCHCHWIIWWLRWHIICSIHRTHLWATIIILPLHHSSLIVWLLLIHIATVHRWWHAFIILSLRWLTLQLSWHLVRYLVWKLLCTIHLLIRSRITWRCSKWSSWFWLCLRVLIRIHTLDTLSLGYFRLLLWDLSWQLRSLIILAILIKVIVIFLLSTFFTFTLVLIIALAPTCHNVLSIALESLSLSLLLLLLSKLLLLLLLLLHLLLLRLELNLLHLVLKLYMLRWNMLLLLLRYCFLLLSLRLLLGDRCSIEIKLLSF